MALITKPQAARRLARAIASDISLYNEDKIVDGIKNDNLFEVIEEEIQEGRDLYDSRVIDEIKDNDNLYERALVDVLVRAKGHIKSKIW